LKPVEIPSENGGWILTHWVSSAEYVNGEGIIKLSFSPKLKPYLLQLKTQFTSYRLSNVLSLNSTYSIRLYELMKKWQHLGKWENSVEELKLKFGVPKESYQRYNHFKTRVILRAVEEVNAKTDLSIDYKEIKKGRGVDRIEFTIRHAPEKEIILSKPKKKFELENEDVRERLKS
jgi:plasmid replication initiation protein